MDPFHQRLTRVALAAAGQYGFCLAGGYAVAAYGFVNRLSEDVDLFTTMVAERDFPTAVEAVVVALKTDGLDATVTMNAGSFARVEVSDPATGENAKLELGVDWRAHPPTRLEISPVLHPDDAVANKMCALFGRAAVRDYIDVDGVLASGRYRLEESLRLAADHDPGFDATMFAETLGAARRLPDSAFVPYGLAGAEATALRDRLVGWSARIIASGPPPSRRGECS
jgi:Domain of unknown function (DUF1814).